MNSPYFVQAFSMFLIVSAISFPLDEGSSHILSISGTLMYVTSTMHVFSGNSIVVVVLHLLESLSMQIVLLSFNVAN